VKVPKLLSRSPGAARGLDTSEQMLARAALEVLLQAAGNRERGAVASSEGARRDYESALRRAGT
jgi:hypothetical protein